MPKRQNVHGRALYLPLVLSAASLGCSKNAIIYNAHGAAIEGPIIRSDVDSITVDVNGTPQTISRENISDIDHPGNGWLVAGAINTGIGVAWAIGAHGLLSEIQQAEDRSKLEAQRDFLRLFGGFLMVCMSIGHLGLGIPTTIWGGTTWYDSRQRAEAPAPTTVHIGPGGVLVRF